MFNSRFNAWAAIPQTSGRVFWVAPAASYTFNGLVYIASDGNDGLDPRRALLTLAQAITLCAANVGDVIVMLPGAHSYAASVAANKAGITITGLPGGLGNPKMKKTSVTVSIDDQIMNVTAADIEVAHINWIPVTTKAAIDLSAAAHRFYCHDCSFDLYTAAASTSTFGIDALGAASLVAVEDCWFESDGAQGPGIDVTALVDSYVRRCTFELQGSGTWAAAATAGAATTRVMFDACNFLDWNGTISAGILGTGATIANGVHIQNCRTGVTVTALATGFDAAEATLSENYDAGVGATDGGVLITAIA